MPGLGPGIHELFVGGKARILTPSAGMALEAMTQDAFTLIFAESMAPHLHNTFLPHKNHEVR